MRKNKKAPAFLQVLVWLPRNSKMLNLWKGFVKLVHYIDENREWLDATYAMCCLPKAPMPKRGRRPPAGG